MGACTIIHARSKPAVTECFSCLECSGADLPEIRNEVSTEYRSRYPPLPVFLLRVMVIPSLLALGEPAAATSAETTGTAAAAGPMERWQRRSRRCRVWGVRAQGRGSCVRSSARRRSRARGRPPRGSVRRSSGSASSRGGA